VTRARARRLTAGDGAGGHVIGFAVGGAIFLLTFSVLIQFALEPASDARPKDANLAREAEDTLRILTSTAGEPATWGLAGGASGDAVARLGLLEPGTSATLSPGKWDALVRGTLVDEANGAVDYPAARAALGLGNKGFHLRAYPIFPTAAAGTYGLGSDFVSHTVAYVGHVQGVAESQESKKESHVLATLPVAFDNVTWNALLMPGAQGDKFPDASASLRDGLVPQLGGALLVNGQQNGDTYRAMRIHRDFLAAETGWTPPEGDHVFAFTDGDDLSYHKNRDVDIVVGRVDLSDVPGVPVLSMKYRLDNGGDDGVPPTTGDYAYLMAGVHIGGGVVSWTRVGPYLGATGTAWETSSAGIGSCVPCLVAPTNANVYLGVRFHSDNDNVNGARGLVFDDIRLVDGGGRTLFAAGFEAPRYATLVVGSAVDQNALTSAHVKHAVRDYVLAGGRLIVLGTDTQNYQWLEPIFDAGIATASGGLFTPDLAHPLLSTPNPLAYANYPTNGYVWVINNGADKFVQVVGSGDDHVLAVSKPQAFGAGSLILTTWLPSQMAGEEPFRFLANSITYGYYARLYLDFGPPVPKGVAVASATRTLLVDKTAVGDGKLVEVALVLHLWE